MSAPWRIVPTSRRTSKADRVDILDADGRFVAGYVQRHHALRMIHDPAQVADEAIGLFLECLARDPDDEDTARAQAVAEISEGCAVDVDELQREMAADMAATGAPIAADDGLPF